jgi:hypothetical protein
MGGVRPVIKRPRFLHSLAWKNTRPMMGSEGEGDASFEIVARCLRDIRDKAVKYNIQQEIK